MRRATEQSRFFRETSGKIVLSPNATGNRATGRHHSRPDFRSMIIVKVTWQGGNKREQFSLDTTLEALVARCAIICDISVDRIEISHNYPPVPLRGLRKEMIATLGVKNGEVLVLREGSGSCFTDAKTAIVENDIETLLRMGFRNATCLQALAIAGSNNIAFAAEICQQTECSLTEGRMFCRKNIAADNSCLFNAIGYLALQDDTNLASMLRGISADIVFNNPIDYPPDILGKSVTDYCSWIRDMNNWGGEIEMQILSKHLQLDITAVQIETGKMYHYHSNWPNCRRIYLLYDGIHYDAAVTSLHRDQQDRVLIDGSTADQLEYQFASDDVVAEQEVLQLAVEMRRQRQFFSLSGCSLQCMICRVGMKGQNEARAHATATGHQSFGQI